MRRILTINLALFLFFWTFSDAQVQATPKEQSNSSQEAVTVGIFHAPPFAIEGDNGWDGIAVHLWRDAAQELGLEYEWQPIERDQIVSSLIDGTADVVISAVANADDEESVDFSYSYYISSIGMAEPAQNTILEIASAFFSPRFWWIALWLALAFLVVGIIAWFFERQTNDEQFNSDPRRGIWAGFWWAGVTMSTIGYGDKAPKTVGGRILALLWMLVAMGITATLTASLTSILATGSGIGSTEFPGDLRRMDVGSVADTVGAQFLAEERIQFEQFDNLQSGLEATADQSSPEIFVDDVAILRYVNNETLNGRLRISATDVHPQHHAFALPQESELREQLNRIILDRIEEPAWNNLINRYMSK